jgi:diaminopimelate epimerase
MNAVEIPFAKVSGAGNDFVAVNNIDGHLKVDWPLFAKAACERHFGVGADGLLVLDPSIRSDFTMLYFNADGSSGGMCGNGGRCCVMFARVNGLEHDDITFEAFGYLYRATFTGNGIRVAMKNPEKIRRGIPVHASAGKFLCHAVNTGAPHVVTYVDDLDAVDVLAAGRELRNHREFQPEGTNVNFVKVLSRDAIAIRTYERGVEAETLACGTGSIASAVISALEKGIAPPVTVITRSGEELRVDLSIEDGNVQKISLEGHARIIFTSKLLFDPASGAIEAQDGI